MPARKKSNRLKSISAAFSQAYQRTYSGDILSAFSTSAFGAASSMFELLGTALSMQAIVSTVAEGRALRLANASLEVAGVHHRLGPDGIIIVILSSMIVSYLLSMAFAHFRDLSFDKFRLRMQKLHFPDSVNDAFLQKRYTKDIKIAEAVVKIFEIIVFSFFILIFVLWLSPYFALSLSAIMVVYTSALLYNKRSDVSVRASLQRARSRVRLKNNAANKNKVQEYFSTEYRVIRYRRNIDMNASILYIVTITLVVGIASLYFNHGSLVVLPLLIILSVRKLLGIARAASNHLSVIFALRDEASENANEGT